MPRRPFLLILMLMKAGTSYVENDTIPNNYQGYAGWGQDSNNITINYIDNGWNNWGWNTGFYGG